MIGHGLGLTIGSRAPVTTSFDPAILFANGEQGVVFDITPANCGVGVNEAVAIIADTSSRGHNAVQATAGARPILRQSGSLHFLDFDGANDAMQTSAIDLATSDAVTIILGLRKFTNAPAAMAVEFSPNAYTNPGAFYVTAPEGTGPASDYRFYARGTISPSAALATGATPAPDTCVLTGIADISSATRILRRDGAQVASSNAALGSGNLRSYPLNLGARAGTSLFFNGRVYGLIVINRTLTVQELAKAEAWMAMKSGIQLD